MKNLTNQWLNYRKYGNDPERYFHREMLCSNHASNRFVRNFKKGFFTLKASLFVAFIIALQLFSSEQSLAQTVCPNGTVNGSDLCTIVITTNGSFTVPQGVTSITVTTWGAGGGGGITDTRAGAAGGAGGYARGTFGVTPANIYDIVIGAAGSGGSGAGSSGSGGGYTGIFNDDIITQGGALIVAGGGGGGGGGANHNSAVDATAGGAGGGTSGLLSTGIGGKAGTQVAGGAGGTGGQTNGTAGGVLSGGSGAGQSAGVAGGTPGGGAGRSGSTSGGGGGAGYYGGGGGARGATGGSPSSRQGGGGGGGGSTFINGSASVTTNTAGSGTTPPNQTGNYVSGRGVGGAANGGNGGAGLVVITYQLDDTPTSLTIQQQPTQTTAGVVISPSPVVLVQDKHGRAVTSEPVTVSLQSGSFTGGSTTLVNTNGSGIATFSNLVIENANTGYILDFDVTGIATQSSSSFNVVAAAADQLVYQQEPTTTLADETITPAVTVRIEDAFGNLTSSTATVYLSIGTNPGSGTLGGDIDVNAVAGVATFSDLDIDNAGSGYTIVASDAASPDGATGIDDVTSGTFDITLGPLDHFSVEANGGGTVGQQTAGSSFGLDITAQDANNNTITTFTGTVDLTLDQNSFASGGGTTGAFTAGVLTNHSVSINVASSDYEITATETGESPSGVTNSFDVVAAAPDYVTLDGPAGTEASSASDPLSITIFDEFDNESPVSGNTVFNLSSDSGGSFSFSTGSTATVTTGTSSTTFTYTDDSFGTHTITAARASGDALPGDDTDTHDITITGTPDSVEMETQPAQSTAGTAISGAPAVLVETASNVPVPGVNVTVSEQGAYSFDSGTLTVQTNASGIAEFSDLVINTVGSYTLVFDADGVGTDATSSSFDVVAAAADQVSAVVTVDDAVADGEDTVEFTVTVTDAFDNPISGATVTVDNALDVASLGGISASDTDVTDGNGEATFTATSTTAGAFSVQFSESVSSDNDSAEATFLADDPDHILLTGPASTSGSEESGDFTITVVDANDNPSNVSGATSFTLGSDSGGSFSFSPSSPVTVADGTNSVTFTYTDDELGTHTITATYSSGGSDGNLGSDTHDISVTAGSADAVSVETQPTTSTAGNNVSGPPTAFVEDEFGNPVSGINVTVSEQGGYTFDGGTLTVATNGSGLAVFSNLVINEAGSYTLVFDADGVGSDATSSSFTVDAAAPDYVTLTGPAFVAIDSESTNLTITVYDEFDNVAEVSGSTSFSLSSTSGGSVTFTPSSPVSISGGNSSTTFTYEDSESGAQTITATRASGDALSGGNSDTHNIIVGGGGSATVVILTAGSTWDVPEDWNSDDNTIEVIGGGSGGGIWSQSGRGGFGGAGGAYALGNNVVMPAGQTVTIALGSAGSGSSTETGNAGGDTYICDATSNCSGIGGGAVVVGAKGGSAGTAAAGSTGGLAAASVGDVTYDGGDGGAGSGSSQTDGAGGGGAAGPNGAGGDGGDSGVSTTGGQGGNGFGGAGGTGGNPGGAGGDGQEFDATHGSGGGGGGATANNAAGGAGGSYGAGGGGSKSSGGTGGSGSPGIIVITYTPNPFYFSRQNGDWDNPSSWSRTGHTGSAANSTPGIESEIFIGGSDSITLNISSFTVDDPGYVTVQQSGILIFSGENYIDGTGEFELDPDGAIEIGSDDGIAASASSGNIQTTTRTLSTESAYTYNGSSAQITGDGLPVIVNNLTIDNSSGVTSTSGVDRTVTGTLTLADGTLTMGPGTSLVTSTIDDGGGGEVEMQVSIDGGTGYRMISSPVETAFSDLLGGFTTQGVSGSDYPSRQPNMLYFLETYADSGTTANASWRGMSGLGSTVAGGRGYFFYVFGNVGGDSDYNDTLPITMSATGVEYSFPANTFDFGVSYTDSRETTDYLEGWNLVGNPTMATLDWDHGDWTRDNVDETYYIWDPSLNSGSGDYIFWNGDAGTAPDGDLIAPFQSFWVKANDDDPDMTITHNVKTTGGTLVGSQSRQEVADDVRIVGLSLEGAGLTGDIFLTFNNDGDFGKDPYDAYRLQPVYTNSYLTFFTTTGGANDPPLVINNMPVSFGDKLQIPLQVGGISNNALISDTFTLDWALPDNWPTDWTITLMDHVQQIAIPMNRQTSYQFSHQTPGDVLSRGSLEKLSFDSGSVVGDQPAKRITDIDLSLPTQIVAGERAVSALENQSLAKQLGKAVTARFTVVIEPGADSGDVEYSGNVPILQHNFPNPFPDATTIRFILPEQQRVTIEVFDTNGRKVAVLADGDFPEGQSTVRWDARGAASGTYHIRMRAGDTILYESATLLR